VNASGIIAGLRTALGQPLPGHDRFLELSGYKRPDLEAALREDPAPRESAVLVLLYPEQEALHTLLMVRQQYDGVHRGQVSFPGGRRETQDVDLHATALREFSEETGVDTAGIEVIGVLSRVYIPPSRSLVTPFVAYARTLGPVRPDPREVKALLRIPLSDLLRENVVQHREHYIQLLGRKATIPYFDLAGQVVWGATAMMLAELRELVVRHG